MEIKIKEVYEKEGKHSFKTALFEGDKVAHERVYFDSKKDFIEKYNDITKGLDGCSVGVPEEFWFENDDKNEKSYFVFIKYKMHDYEFIVVMNRAIYITNKGQTIDIT